MKRIKMMCFLLALLGLLSACSAHSVDAEEQSAPTWQSRYDLGVRYLSDGRYEEAILAFTAAIEIDPKNAQAYEQRGDAYWELAQSAQGSEQTDAYRSAAEDYESAMQWGSETDELYRRAADAYYGAQDYEKAESYYEKLLEKDEDVLARLIECSRALGTGGRSLRSGCRRVISRRVKNDICRRSASFGRRRRCAPMPHFSAQTAQWALRLSIWMRTARRS